MADNFDLRAGALEDMFSKIDKNKFLRVLDKDRLWKYANKASLPKALAKKGFSNLDLKFKLRADGNSQLSLINHTEGKTELLSDWVVFEERFNDPAFPELEGSRVLYIEWLMFSNPRQKSDPSRPLLPGQTAPGLGILKQGGYFISYVADAIDAEAVAITPEHYHNAVMFSRNFKYIDPVLEGILKALKRDLKHLDLSQASWAVELECVQEMNTEGYFQWIAGKQAVPVSGGAFRRYFKSSDYKRITKANKKRRFVFDEEKFLIESKRIPALSNLIV